METLFITGKTFNGMFVYILSVVCIQTHTPQPTGNQPCLYVVDIRVTKPLEAESFLHSYRYQTG